MTGFCCCNMTKYRWVRFFLYRSYFIVSYPLQLIVLYHCIQLCYYSMVSYPVLMDRFFETITTTTTIKRMSDPCRITTRPRIVEAQKSPIVNYCVDTRYFDGTYTVFCVGCAQATTASCIIHVMVRNTTTNKTKQTKPDNRLDIDGHESKKYRGETRHHRNTRLLCIRMATNQWLVGLPLAEEQPAALCWNTSNAWRSQRNTTGILFLQGGTRTKGHNWTSNKWYE